MNADDEDLSGVLVDQLFRDLGTLTALDAVVPSDVAGSAVLSSLPPQFAVSYDARFTRKFIVAASDVTASLVRGWTAPGCLAAELAVRCLLDQAEITEDIYELDLPEDWRAQVEEVLLEEAESPTLYSDSPASRKSTSGSWVSRAGSPRLLPGAPCRPTPWLRRRGRESGRALGRGLRNHDP
ncbi:hypothetical protein AHiyo4_14720 [Arthrobacter sp. Hiyo4]|nr:hypothetical protein AHiyo4_14720 [Arthrobacter sp. Hiyo4]